MQRINILGVALADYSLKESLILLDEYTKNGRLNTILYLTAPMLILAGKDEQEKNCIESMDLTLCGDAELLRAAKIESVSRHYEVENRVFLKEFLRRMVRENRKIYLLAESETELEMFHRDLENLQSGLQISGSDVLSAETTDTEEIINRINDVAPAAIISRLPHGGQERYMTEFKSFANAEVWLGISKDMVLGASKEPFRKRIMDRIYKKIFRRWMNRSEDEKGK